MRPCGNDVRAPSLTRHPCRHAALACPTCACKDFFVRPAKLAGTHDANIVRKGEQKSLRFVNCRLPAAAATARKACTWVETSPRGRLACITSARSPFSRVVCRCDPLPPQPKRATRRHNPASRATSARRKAMQRKRLVGLHTDFSVGSGANRLNELGFSLVKSTKLRLTIVNLLVRKGHVPWYLIIGLGHGVAIGALTPRTPRLASPRLVHEGAPAPGRWSVGIQVP